MNLVNVDTKLTLFLHYKLRNLRCLRVKSITWFINLINKTEQEFKSLFSLKRMLHMSRLRTTVLACSLILTTYSSFEEGAFHVRSVTLWGSRYKQRVKDLVFLLCFHFTFCLWDCYPWLFFLCYLERPEPMHARIHGAFCLLLSL